jgi:hypothetical protein
MNKLVKLLSVFALATTVSFWSCKGDQGIQGETGPVGPQGTAGVNGTNGTNGTNGKDGLNGNANVQSFQTTVKVADWKDVLVSSVGSGVSSTYGGVTIQNPLITTEKFVMIFLKSGVTLKALPILYTTSDNGAVERLDYSYQTGQAELYYRSSTQMFGGTITLRPSQDLTFEVVVTSKTVGASLEKSGVDLKNYKEVMNFLSTSL